MAADPDAIILDLCYNRTSAEDKFRAFLRYYVKTSVQLRPSLGPEEYEWVRDVDSAITVTELWKALVREFDCGFLQTMRRQEPEKVSLYSLKFCDTSQGAGSVWKVSKVWPPFPPTSPGLHLFRINADARLRADS
ncbi:hypothetical protein ACHAQH_009250 [Verticillium albo-atrum]